MLRIAALAVLAGVFGSAPPARAAISERAPYYMCFAYTPDGMLFAGGDFDLRRAQKMITANCSMPRTVTVVLLKTIMVHRNGKTYHYAVPDR